MSSPLPSVPTSAGAVLRRTLRRRRGSVLAAAGLITAWSVCEALVPVVIGVVVDRAVATGDVVALAWTGALLVALFAVLSYAYRFGSRVAFDALQREGHALRTEVSSRVLDPHGARTERLPGEVLTIATGDADLVSQLVRQVATSSGAIAGLLVAAVALAVIDPVLAVVVLVGVPLVLVLTHLLSAPLERRTAARQESLGRATGIATDLVQGLRPLQGIGAQDAAFARYREESRLAVRRSVAAARWEGALYGATDALGGVFLAVVALLAGLRALAGDLGVGELISVVGLAQFVAEPMGLVAYLVAQSAQSRAAAGRIAGFLASPPLVVSGDRSTDGPDGPGSGSGLVLDDVHHAGLRGVSLAVRPGELVAVVAEDPAHAAALLALCHGEAVPARGTLTVRDVALTEQDLAGLRSHLLVADHHVDLFEGTLRSNVDPASRVDDDRLAQVLAATAADDVVAHAPLGLLEPVSVGGTTLSGGQRQRVALARALAADAEVLVLDEPTTAVDAVTEQRIAEGLRRLRARPGRATLVVTSSPALLSRADRVVHLRDGVVVASGTHHELAGDAAYRAAVLR